MDPTQYYNVYVSNCPIFDVHLLLVYIIKNSITCLSFLASILTLKPILDIPYTLTTCALIYLLIKLLSDLVNLANSNRHYRNITGLEIDGLDKVTELLWASVFYS